MKEASLATFQCSASRGVLCHDSIKIGLLTYLSTCTIFTSSDTILPAGIGTVAEEEQPREGGFLDLGGRECLACHISSEVPQGFPTEGCGEGDKGAARRAAQPLRRRARWERSELYLVLDAKAFLLATPDR